MAFKKKQTKKDGEEPKKKFKKHSKLATMGLGKEKMYFMDNLAMLLGSGMGVMDALYTIAMDSKTPTMKKILLQCREEIEEGSTVFQALTNSRLFRHHILALVQLGEESGRLIQNLEVIVIEQQKDKVFKSKIKSAMMYPVFVLAITGVVSIGIAWFLLPKLASVFDGLDAEVPAITQLMLNGGEFLKSQWYWFFPMVFLGGAIAFHIFFKHPKFKIVGQDLLFKIPGVGQLIKEVEVARLGYLFGTLLDAGLPMTTSLGSLSEATTFLRFRWFYAYMAEAIEEGESIKSSFDSYKNSDKLIPRPIQQLIVAGESSGKMYKILLKIGKNYEGKTDETAKNMTVILEPLLLIIIFTGVIGVALAVITPIYGVLGGLNK